jgi:hypothetical protein
VFIQVPVLRNPTHRGTVMLIAAQPSRTTARNPSSIVIAPFAERRITQRGELVPAREL